MSSVNNDSGEDEDYQEYEKQFVDGSSNQVPDKIKQSIKKYYELAVLLKGADEDVKKLKKEMKLLNIKIQTFMVENEVSQFNTEKIDLSIHKRNAVEPINKNSIERILSTKYDELQAKEISDYIYDNRNTTEKVGLRKRLKNQIRL